MRDVLLTAIILGTIPFILRRPYIGILVYVWISVMNPHRLTWGFAYAFNFAAIIAGVTLISAIISKDLRRPPINTLTVALFLFVVWTAVTTAFSLYPAQSFDIWASLTKTQVMVFFIPMLFHRKDNLRQLIWVIVLSIAFYGTKGGVFSIVTGGENRVWGPAGSYIEDNNALAIAIIITIPLMRYLQLTTAHKFVRWGLTAMMLLCGVAVLGTYSRGALFAVTAMIFFLWWKTRQKLSLLVIAAIAIPAALYFMPERWYERMDTIATYEQDSSARMRLNAWGTMFNIAKDRPIVGSGFEAATREVFDRYSPDPSYPPQAAHSIYFQALGEHGFVGLALYLFLYLTFWRHAGTLVRRSKGQPHLAWARDFGLMMQVSLIGFAVGGAFLSLVNFDVPYYLVGALVVANAIADREWRSATETAPASVANALVGIPPNRSPKPDSG